MRLVIIPQALRLVIPPTGNQFIGMLKPSALISVIGVRELLLTADQALTSSFRYFKILAAAGVYYLLTTTVFMLQKHLERIFNRHSFASARWPA